MAITVQFRDDYGTRVVLGSLSTTEEFEDFDGKFLGVVDSNAEWFLKDFVFLRTNFPYHVFKEPDELTKDQRSVNDIHDFLFLHAADRDTTLVVVGGGITLDVAGYAASSYKRGIDWISIPTTLLAQVDASIGGKTGINHPRYGKNVIGAFHPSVLTLIDPSCCARWTEAIELEGVAEMYKIFKVFDHSAVSRLLHHRDRPDTLVERSLELKAGVVSVDPHEDGLRYWLNYGHTFGHALETTMNTPEQPRTLPHGIAVSVGMRLANCVAYQLGIMSKGQLDRADTELDVCEFPKPDLPPFDDLLPFMDQDKKARNGYVNMCLVDGKTEISFLSGDPRVEVANRDLQRGYDLYEERR